MSELKTYKPLTLGELIERLDSLGAAEVRGLDGMVRSYRGYYERNATEPCDWVRAASVLAENYSEAIGSPITGYKGGDYTVNEDELIYYAGYGDTGPQICGLEIAADGIYQPVLVEEVW